MAKKYRVAVIGRTGHGDYGHELSDAWAAVPQTEVVAVADDDPAGLAKAAARLKVEKAYADYRKMLDEVKPDIVNVCPRFLDQHHAMVMAAVERGLHVFLEKPMCRTLAEADEIVRTSDMTHARIVVAHQTRYSPKIATVKKLIRDGKLGEILELRGRGKEDARGGAEDLWVLGSHVMDLIRTFGGDAQWCFAAVTSQGKPIGKRDVQEGKEGMGPIAGDSVHAMYGMAGGATGYFASRRGVAGAPSRFGLQIFGSAGMLEFETGYLASVKFLADPSWSPARSKKAWQNVSSAGIGLPEPLEKGGLAKGNEAAVSDLVASIEENRAPLMNAVEARAAIEMIVACFESARTAGRVALPLEERGNPLLKLEK